MQEYEKLGVQATFEMQRAARGVAAENATLRSMLRRRGVSDGEIEQFLRSAPGNSNYEEPNEAAKAQQPEFLTLPPSYRSMEVSQRQSGVFEPTVIGKECCDGKTTCSLSPGENAVRPGANTGSVQPASFAPNAMAGATTTTMDYNSATTMSCNTAARILADMQGHEDTRRTRASLGCVGQDECIVKNTALFQILDGSGGPG